MAFNAASDRSRKAENGWVRQKNRVATSFGWERNSGLCERALPGTQNLGTHEKCHVVQRKSAGVTKLVHGASLPGKAKLFTRVRKSPSQLRHGARVDWWL